MFCEAFRNGQDEDQDQDFEIYYRKVRFYKIKIRIKIGSFTKFFPSGLGSLSRLGSGFRFEIK